MPPGTLKVSALDLLRNGTTRASLERPLRIAAAATSTAGNERGRALSHRPVSLHERESRPMELRIRELPLDNSIVTFGENGGK